MYSERVELYKKLEEKLDSSNALINVLSGSVLLIEDNEMLEK